MMSRCRAGTAFSPRREVERFRFAEISYHRVGITAPTTHAVTVAEVRTRLRLGGDDVDADLQLMIGEAEAWWETATGCHLMPQVSELRLDRFPAHDAVLPLMHQPIRSVDRVEYYATAAATTMTSWPAANYQTETDTRGGRLRLRTSWPSTDKRLDAVRIQMSTGYASAAGVAPDVKAAVLLYVGARYLWREEVAEKKLTPIPMGAQTIADRHRLHWLPVEVR